MKLCLRFKRDSELWLIVIRTVITTVVQINPHIQSSFQFFQIDTCLSDWCNVFRSDIVAQFRNGSKTMERYFTNGFYADVLLKNGCLCNDCHAQTKLVRLTGCADFFLISTKCKALALWVRSTIVYELRKLLKKNQKDSIISYSLRYQRRYIQHFVKNVLRAWRNWQTHQT